MAPKLFLHFNSDPDVVVVVAVVAVVAAVVVAAAAAAAERREVQAVDIAAVGLARAAVADLEVVLASVPVHEGVEVEIVVDPVEEEVGIVVDLEGVAGTVVLEVEGVGTVVDPVLEMRVVEAVLGVVGIALDVAGLEKGAVGIGPEFVGPVPVVLVGTVKGVVGIAVGLAEDVVQTAQVGDKRVAPECHAPVAPDDPEEAEGASCRGWRRAGRRRSRGSRAGPRRG